MDAQTQAKMIASVQNAVDRTLEASEEKRKKYEAIEDAEGFGAAWAAYLIEEECKRKDARPFSLPADATDATDAVDSQADEEAESVDDPKNPSYIENVLGMFGPKQDGFGPVFSAFVRKLAVADNEVRSQYAVHCAEEKRKREADAADEPAERIFVKGIRGGGAPKPSGTTFVARRGGELHYIPPCPMCGNSEDILLNGEKGLECTDCGEIFEVPIGPENEASEISAFGEVGEIFEIAQPAPPEQHAARRAEEKWQRVANDAVDAATYATFAVEALLGRKSNGNECPMCGSTSVEQIDWGLECQVCGEIFEVPIVPENAVSDAAIPESATITKMPKFIISDAARTPSFVDLLNKYFAPLGRE
jgi:ribosomal protein L37AE/L43A